MPAEYFFICLILFISSFMQGFAGLGFALVSVPLLSIFMDVKTAISLSALSGFLINIFLFIQFKEHVRVFELKSLIIGSIVGIPFGVLFLSHANASMIKTTLGIIIIGFAVLSLFQFIKQHGLHDRWGYLFGLISGLLGGAFNTNGPPVVIYFCMKGWDKNKQKGSISAFFLVSSIIIVTAHIITGISTKSLLFDYLTYIPFVLIGLLLGNYFFGKVSTEFFNKFLLYILLIIGLSMFLR